MLKEMIINTSGGFENKKDIDEDVKRALEEFFVNFAMGNEGYARCESYNRNGVIISFDVLVRHKHVAVIAGRRTVVYAMNSHAIADDVNVLNPDPTKLTVCIDSPTGQICMNIQELITLIGVIIGA